MNAFFDNSECSDYGPVTMADSHVAKPNMSVYESADLVLIRGLPGSGKSTIARTLRLVGYHHFEADMFFEVAGKYLYDASRIRDAHQWC